MGHLQVVKKHLAEHGLNIKVSKCSFVQTRVNLLGHVVDRTGVHVDVQKIAAMKSFPRPKSAKKLCSFLWIAEYYTRFITGFANISVVLQEETYTREDSFT